MKPANDNAPRLLTKKAAAAYLGVSTPTFAKWVLTGVLPAAAGSTKMWDRKSLDLSIDKMSGLSQAKNSTSEDDSYDEWKRKYEARKATRAQRIR